MTKKKSKWKKQKPVSPDSKAILRSQRKAIKKLQGQLLAPDPAGGMQGNEKPITPHNQDPGVFQLEKAGMEEPFDEIQDMSHSPLNANISEEIRGDGALDMDFFENFLSLSQPLEDSFFLEDTETIERDGIPEYEENLQSALQSREQSEIDEPNFQVEPEIQKETASDGADKKLKSKQGAPFSGWSDALQSSSRTSSYRHSQPAIPLQLQQTILLRNDSEAFLEYQNKVAMLTLPKDEIFLNRDFAILRALIFKNKCQHRRVLAFKHLQEVQKLMRQIDAAQIGALIDFLQSIPSDNSKQTSERRCTQGETIVFISLRLISVSRICEHLIKAIRKAALHSLPHISRGHFMKMYVTVLAILARSQVYAGRILINCVANFNHLAQLAGLLPFSSDNGPLTGKGLPQMLICSWRDSLPTIESIPFDSGKEIPEQAKQNMLMGDKIEGENLLDFGQPISEDEQIAIRAKLEAEKSAYRAGIPPSHAKVVAPENSSDFSTRSEKHIQDSSGQQPRNVRAKLNKTDQSQEIPQKISRQSQGKSQNFSAVSRQPSNSPSGQIQEEKENLGAKTPSLYQIKWPHDSCAQQKNGVGRAQTNNSAQTEIRDASNPGGYTDTRIPDSNHGQRKTEENPEAQSVDPIIVLEDSDCYSDLLPQIQADPKGDDPSSNLNPVPLSIFPTQSMDDSKPQMTEGFKPKKLSKKQRRRQAYKLKKAEKLGQGQVTQPTAKGGEKWYLHTNPEASTEATKIDPVQNNKTLNGPKVRSFADSRSLSTWSQSKVKIAGSQAKNSQVPPLTQRKYSEIKSETKSGKDTDLENGLSQSGFHIPSSNPKVPNNSTEEGPRELSQPFQPAKESLSTFQFPVTQSLEIRAKDLPPMPIFSSQPLECQMQQNQPQLTTSSEPYKPLDSFQQQIGGPGHFAGDKSGQNAKNLQIPQEEMKQYNLPSKNLDQRSDIVQSDSRDSRKKPFDTQNQASDSVRLDSGAKLTLGGDTRTEKPGVNTSSLLFTSSPDKESPNNQGLGNILPSLQLEMNSQNKFASRLNPEKFREDENKSVSASQGEGGWLGDPFGVDEKFSEEDPNLIPGLEKEATSPKSGSMPVRISMPSSSKSPSIGQSSSKSSPLVLSKKRKRGK